MKQVLVATFSLLSLLSGVNTAEAGRCCYGYRVRYYRVHPHYYYVQPAPRPPRWSIGIHGTALSTNQMFADEAVFLTGFGGHMRFRGYRLGMELSADVAGRQFLNGAIRRVSVPIQLSALLYLIPEGVFNLYLLGGGRVVATTMRLEYPDLQSEQTFGEYGLHGGLGAELNLGRVFAFTADARFFGVWRGSYQPDGSFYADAESAIVPESTTGLQINLGMSWRW